MSGELLALLSALVWSISSVLFTVSARRIHVLPMNLVRCTVSTAFFWAMLPFFGGWQALRAIPSEAWLWLVVSVLGLLVIGDTLYFRAMDLAGVSWAVPVASVNTLWAVLLAAVFVDEPLTGRLLAGTLLVVGGVTLLSIDTPRGAGRGLRWPRRRAGNAGGQIVNGTGTQPGTGSAEPDETTLARRRRTGLGLALLVSFLWAGGLLALKPATADISSIVANSVRQPMGLLILLGVTLISGRWRDLRGLDRRSWGIVLVASLVGTGIGTLLFVMAIQLAGAGKTAVLTSTTPVLALPFSMLWLGERPNRRTLAGTVLTTLGIALVA